MEARPDYVLTGKPGGGPGSVVLKAPQVLRTSRGRELWDWGKFHTQGNGALWG